MAGIIGEFADVESVVALKDLLNRMDCDNFEIRNVMSLIMKSFLSKC